MSAVRFLLPVLAVFLILSVPAVAQQPANANDTLLAATSPFEDMVEFALAGDDAGLARSMAAADRQEKSVQTVMSAEGAEQLDGLLNEVHEAVAHKEYQAVARAGVKVFRLILDEVQPNNLTVPKEVDLLDCAGFSLMVAAADTPVEWHAMRKTAEEAAAWWKALEPKVTDTALRDAFSDAIGGLTEAAKAENLSLLNLAYKMDLDLVDLLEHYFEGR